MKSFFITLIAALILAACHPNPNKITVKSDDGKSSATIDVSNVEKNANEMQNKTDALKKLTPLTTDQLKAMLPQEINGIQRSSFDVNSAMGISVGDAEYKKNDTTSIKIGMYDCAGETGSAYYSASYWLKMNMQSESDNGYTKTVDLLGGKAVETYEKSSNHYTLVYLGNDRILVSLEGNNISADELRNVAKSLNMKVS